MPDIELAVRRRYLDRLDESTWIDDDPRLDFGTAALPHFIAAFENEYDPERRARLMRVIRQFRDLAALPTLAIGLRDSSDVVWKDALDGIVVLGGQAALAILAEAHIAAASQPSATEKIEWIDEALNQIITGFDR